VAKANDVRLGIACGTNERIEVSSRGDAPATSVMVNEYLEAVLIVQRNNNVPSGSHPGIVVQEERELLVTALTVRELVIMITRARADHLMSDRLKECCEVLDL